MQKINILYVITKLELGGAQKQLLSLISNLDKERFNPFLFTAWDGLLIQDALNISVQPVKRSFFLKRSINPIKDLVALFEIYLCIKKHHIDIVHTHSSKAGILGRIAARLAGARGIIHTVHGWSFNDYQPSLLRFFYIGLERICARLTHKLIVVSNYDRYKGNKHHIGRESQYELIRYGIDYSEFCTKVQDIKEEFKIKPDDLVVGMIGCFKPQKCPEDFVKLAYLVHRAFPQLKFILVGDGILRQRIQRLVHKLRLKEYLILTGWRRDIPAILEVFDVFVLTSLWEGMPISVIEAMVCSKPVLATDTGGISEVIVEAKTGFLVKPHDIKTMAERLMVLLRNRDLRKTIGQAARDFLGIEFSLLNLVTHTQALYTCLI